MLESTSDAGVSWQGVTGKISLKLHLDEAGENYTAVLPENHRLLSGGLTSVNLNATALVSLPDPRNALGFDAAVALE
ncbi:MAG: hypothetical protein AB8B36_14655, partial [Prochlorococcus sp.]